MAETGDKPRRTDLDLFVLALIDSGVSTPYELQKAAGLSQGATIPALQRLLDARLVRQAKPGARGRTDYQTTAAGKRLMKNGWLALIEKGPSGTLIPTFVWPSWHCWEVAIVGWLPTSSISRLTRKWSRWLPPPNLLAIQAGCLFCHAGTAICDPQPRRPCSRLNRRPSAPWPTLCPGSSPVSPRKATAPLRNRRAP